MYLPSRAPVTLIFPFSHQYFRHWEDREADLFYGEGLIAEFNELLIT